MSVDGRDTVRVRVNSEEHEVVEGALVEHVSALRSDLDDILNDADVKPQKQWESHALHSLMRFELMADVVMANEGRSHFFLPVPESVAEEFTRQLYQYGSDIVANNPKTQTGKDIYEARRDRVVAVAERVEQQITDED